MTDYIIEVNGRIIAEYVDDGRNEVVVVTPKASVFHRKFKEPKMVKQVVNELIALGK